MNKRLITRVPFPGGSGQTPTGAMQFEGDWPGLFIRGDAAIDLMCKIRALVERLGKQEDPVVGLALMRLQQIADLIERDVVVRREGPT